MGDYAHVTAYGAIKVGREKQAMAVWGDALDFYEKAKANGIIESYEIQMFQPTGGALPVGMITLWGSEDQVDQISRHEDRHAPAGTRLASWSRTSWRHARCVVPRSSRVLPTSRRRSTACRSRRRAR